MNSGKRVSGDKIIGRPYDPVADMLVNSHQTVPVHSGLFATASDVARIVERLQGNNLPELSHQLWASWMFDGWCEYKLCDDLDSRIFVTTGGMVSPVSPPYGDPGGKPGRYFMKTGYTGCLLWVDVEKKITVALLTNASAAEYDVRWEEFSQEIIETVKKGS
jgi:CubicO group peptidase (beta-lactamase class C family)